MRKLLTALTVLAGGLIVAVTALPAQAQSTPSVRGTIESVDNYIPTANARVEIEILDISGQGEPTTVLGRQSISNPAQFPVSFEVTYDPAAINASRTYAVRVRVYDAGRLMLANVTPARVITSGNPTEVTIYVSDVATY